ncbi:MAG: hypothetical protein R3C59_12150 [Planctomycetaceae bacterium]
MKHFLTYAVLSTVLTSIPSATTAGLWSRQADCEEPRCCAETCSDGSCCGSIGCDGTACCDSGHCCRSECKTCKGECKSIKVKKYCWQTECEDVCIPPVQLPCCRCLFKGKCRGCCDAGAGGCSSGCTGCPTCQPAPCCQNGLLKKLFGRCAGCRVRCVSRLKAEDYECEKNVMEWSVVSCGDCAGCCSGLSGTTGCGDQNPCCRIGTANEPPCCGPIGCTSGGQ